MRKISWLICLVAIAIIFLADTSRTAETLPEEEKERTVAEYTIGTDDVLDISVWGIAELAKKVIVRPDGKISFPLIGDIQAEGLTLPQLDMAMTKKLSEYVREPEVAILMDKFGGKKILILGQVRNPGSYRFVGRVSIMDSIAMAGGFNENAVLRSTKVIRGSLKDPEVISVNAERLFKRGDLAQNINIQPGDIIYVPRRFIANVNYWIRQITPSLTGILTYEAVAE